MSVVIIKKAGHLVPLPYLKEVHKPFNAGYGIMCVQSDGTFLREKVIGKDKDNNPETLFEVLRALTKEQVVIHLMSNKDGKALDHNVGPFTVFEKDGYAIASMLSGDFSQFDETGNDEYSDDHHGNAKLVTPIISSLAAGGAKDKIFSDQAVVFNTTFSSILKDKSFIALLSSTGGLYTFGKPKTGFEYPWGSTTDKLSYVEVSSDKKLPDGVKETTAETRKVNSAPPIPAPDKKAAVPAASTTPAQPAGVAKKEPSERPKMFKTVVEAASFGHMPAAKDLVSKSACKTWWRRNNKNHLPDDWDWTRTTSTKVLYEKHASVTLGANGVASKAQDAPPAPVQQAQEREVAPPAKAPVIEGSKEQSKKDVVPHHIVPKNTTVKEATQPQQVSKEAIAAAHKALDATPSPTKSAVNGDAIVETILKRHEAYTKQGWVMPNAGTFAVGHKVHEKLIGMGSKEITDPDVLKAFFKKVPLFTEQMQMKDLKEVCGWTVDTIKDVVKNHPDLAAALVIQLRHELYFEDEIEQMGKEKNTKVA